MKQEWQPIESAPLGEWVLVYCPEMGRGHMMVDYRAWDENDEWMFEPTHWMPLPGPPPCK